MIGSSGSLGRLHLIDVTPYDVEACRIAGVRIIALTCGGWTKQDLTADEVYTDPEALVERLDQSMLAS